MEQQSLDKSNDIDNHNDDENKNENVEIKPKSLNFSSDQNDNKNSSSKTEENTEEMEEKQWRNQYERISEMERTENSKTPISCKRKKSRIAIENQFNCCECMQYCIFIILFHKIRI